MANWLRDVMTYIAPRFQDKIKPYSKQYTGQFLGAFIGMPESIYHSIDAFSQSYAKEFMKSPAHGLAYSDREYTMDPDREMFKAVHLLTLEPEEQHRIVIKDGRWTGALKDEVRELMDIGYIVLKEKDFSTARDMAASIKKNQRANGILSKSLPEVSIFWIEHTDNGDIYCKARCDSLALLDEGIWLGDLKSFTDVYDEMILGTQVHKRGYHMQQAWYTRGIFKIFQEDPVEKFWIWVEDKRPHGVKYRVCPVELINRGWAPFPALLSSYAKCLNENDWPSYVEDTKEISLPNFYKGVEHEEV